MRVEYSGRAEADLEAIYDYTIERWSRAQARTYLMSIRDGVQAILDDRTHVRTIPEREGVMMTRVQSHYLIFTKQDDVLKIRRVLHVNMDLMAHI